MYVGGTVDHSCHLPLFIPKLSESKANIFQSPAPFKKNAPIQPVE
jgi:hypothetical protein